MPNEPFKPYYVEVVLPLPLNATFTYRVPEHLQVRLMPGFRVIVPFGRKRYYTGIVVNVGVEAPVDFEVKEVLMALDDKPILRHPQLNFWRWIADYYMSSLGDVYKAAVPAGLKVESETYVEINPDFDPSDLATDITEREDAIVSFLNKKGRTPVDYITKETGLRNVEAAVAKLLDKGLVVVSEKMVERYRPRKEKRVRLLFDTADADARRKAFEAVKGSPRQEQLLLTLVQLIDAQRRQDDTLDVKREVLLERSGCSSTILQLLAKKGLAEGFAREVNRFACDEVTEVSLPKLSEAQSTALSQIHESFTDHGVTLLHGVTSSGKTEIYMHIIDFVLRQGNQVLMLVPEIALTTQLTRRLQRVFGRRVIIYHSKFSDNERVDIWRRLLNSSEPCVVLGARSALFLPFAHLGLVIVDEEHESSYKQYDPAPRYNARDSAIMLASMHGAKTLLGSATPSIETYYKTTTGKWGRVDLTERYGDAVLPTIEIVDMQRVRKQHASTGAFSPTLISQVRQSIAHGKQAILFHNRRGYAPMVRCKQCAWVPKCTNCDVSLTVHRHHNALVCHYCGAVYPLPTECPQCHEHDIDHLGYGTERIEEEVDQLFADTRMLRMDLDTTRNKDSYERIIDEFSSHKADLLVGTQMVTKGLDFGDVEIVGVLNADQVIHYPDFRSTERAYNMLAQVSGRAGRRNDSPGKVIVQTADQSHPVIRHLAAHDFMAYYEEELAQRQAFMYPPFTKLIFVYLRHRDSATVEHLAVEHANHLRTLLGNRVFGPEEPAIGRVQQLYIRKIMIKIENGVSPSRVKAALNASRHQLLTSPASRGLIIHYDVDPM